MLSPLLIIGVGGAGGKTIRAMKQELNRILESSGYTGGIPAAWQFLQIDTTYDGVDFPAPMLDIDEFHCVAPQGADIYEITESLINRSTASEQQKMFAGWGVAMPSVKISGFFGPIRAIGRQVGVADWTNTLKAIQNSISKMQSPTVMTELASVASCTGSSRPVNNPLAIIISSLGGVSASGMFMDISEILKCAAGEGWAHSSISFLYTPDVFRSSGHAGNHVSKNTLGAVNELMASQWVGISDETKLLYSSMGLVTGSESGGKSYGCKTNILIGARNSVADIGSGTEGSGMNQIFLAIGESLATVVSNERIYEFLIKNYAHRSWSHGAEDMSGLASKKFIGPTGLSSIGFGKLTVGADRIVDYVADAMTKIQVENLLWPESTPALLKSGVDPVALIQEKAEQIWPNFLLDSGLDERGSQNQIVKELLPDLAEERVKQCVNSIMMKNVSSTAIPPATFSKEIWPDWETQSNTFLTTVKNEISRKAQEWVPSIQEKFRDIIANELMLNGYAVLTYLIERLEVELRDYTIPELLREGNENSNAISGFDQHAFTKRMSEITDGLTGVSNQNGQFSEKLSQSLTRALEYQINSYVNALAVSLVQDLLSRFMAPLKQQLKDSRSTLQIVLRSDQMGDGSRNPHKSFPNWGSGIVPNYYKNRSIERILIDSTDYESTYDFYASKDSQGEPAFQQSVKSALIGKKLNWKPGDINSQTLITQTTPWITSVRDAQGIVGAAVTELEWNFHTDIAELSGRNRRWLKHEDSTFGKFTNMSIREFVSAAGEAPQVRDKRERSFTMEYRVMLKLAQPLIEINHLAMSHIYSVSDGSRADGKMILTNKIPFAFSSSVGQECKRVLEENGYSGADPGFEQSWFDAGSNDSNMFAISTIQNTLPPWAFASLTEPILEQVEISKSISQTWNLFWDGRRTRPLTEAIPFETEMRRSIITGWFVASLFGMCKVRPLRTGRTVQIWNPTLETPDWSTFPSPLLATRHEDSQRESWVLPQLLMSAGIALANFGKTGDTKNIEGYRFLLYLGREVTTSMPNRDQWNLPGSGDLLSTGERSRSQYLKNWVESGESPYLNEELLKVLQVSLALSPDRTEALIKTVQLTSAEYKSIWDTFSETPWHSLPETWELKEDIDLALNDIAAYIGELGSLSSSTIA